ncbi:hypothetical protein NEIRO03_0306 [Nematocida sp. AWRm78]|nr:hypothetical protein NEIRO02_0307 [Nematocida sp. AWRm79]KAI5182642.1 hypothetical protein NEIRO03_0306 [Nematocida sp. AWRm78]
MLTTEDLCRKGFYGIQIKDLKKNEIITLKDQPGVEIVTESSLRKVKETLDPTLFKQDPNASINSYIRASNKEFTQYMTNGRLNFNCPEYYFILHELVVHDHPVSCNDTRIKLKIGAKSFFYFIKKLVLSGVVKKLENGSKIALCKDDLPQEKELPEYPPPKHLLQHVPIYVQIRNLLTRAEGTSTQQIKEYLGIKNRQAHVALRHVMQEFGDEIKIVTEFEGKTRRHRYILKEHYGNKEKQFETHMQGVEAAGSIEVHNDCIDTEQRTRVIEDLVSKEQVIMYNKAFHQKISEILGSKHTIDKNTVVRTARTSSKIDLVCVYIKYAMKTISRNVFKICSLKPTDPVIINCIRKEGYKSFSIVTNNGVIDYNYEDEYTDGPQSAEKSTKPSRLDDSKKYYKGILFTEYENLFASEGNGYVLKKENRLRILKDFWRKSPLRIEKNHQTVDELPMGILFSVFPFSAPNLRNKVHEFYSGLEKDWVSVPYKNFRKDVGVELSKYFTAKKYLNILTEYIDELLDNLELKEMHDPSTNTVYYALCDKEVASSVEEDSLMRKELSFINKEEREALYRCMCNELEKRADCSKPDGTIPKQIAFGVGIDSILHSRYSTEIKSDIIGLFIRKQSFKKTYSISNSCMKISPANYDQVLAEDIELNNKVFSKEQILQCIYAVKTELLNKGTVWVLETFQEYDYFLLEYVILTLNAYKVLMLSKASIRNNVIIQIKIFEEYKKAVTNAKIALYRTNAISDTHQESSEAYSSSMYLQTFGIDGISKISSDNSAVSYAAASLFLYLIHNGAVCLNKAQQKNFTTRIEIETIINQYPTIFLLHIEKKYSDSVVMLR